MPVTTRSAGRASAKNPEKTTTKRTSNKQNDLHAVNNTTTKANAKDPYPAKMPPQSRRLLEWISLKDPPNSFIPNSDELFATLQEIQKLQGCTGIARGRPHELRDIEWLIIEWRSSRDREEFRTSELCLRLNEALATRLRSQEVACLLPDRGHIIAAHPISPPQMLYEVLTIYFPIDLDQGTISSIEKFRGLPCWHIDGENPAGYPSAALKDQIPIMWKEGTCEYQGQTARRFVYFIKFVNEEGERAYKEKMRYNPRGRSPWDIMLYFFG
ncbi:hypothetical protein N7449_006345 [Penicillium cf. viridicatum]|uniref:Uncharacterized protein n=1 Tax=Penicillium cf. viridicatum TaxID=2972119 RepID=A0A9W9MAG6_9EURO|nr:hypothetical protein N7449_006345 [Penicillium cf. viridicatum]